MIVRLALALVVLVASVLYIGYAIGNPEAAKDTALPSIYVAAVVTLLLNRVAHRGKES